MMATENKEYVCEKLMTNYSACTCIVHTNRSKYRENKFDIHAELFTS